MLYPVCCVDCGMFTAWSKRKFTGCFICKTCGRKKDGSWVSITNRMLSD